MHYVHFKLLVQFAPRYITPRNECSREHSLPGTKVPGNSRPWSEEFPGTFLPRSECSKWELSLRGAKIPGSEKSLNHSNDPINSNTNPNTNPCNKTIKMTS